MNNVVTHHIKYKEIDGVDETTEVTQKEHKRIHKILREKGIFLPSDIKGKILNNSHYRAHKKQEIEEAKLYRKTNVLRKLYFYTHLGENVRLCESVDYNTSTGSISFYSRFMGTNGKKIYLLSQI